MECKLILISPGMQETFSLREGTMTIGRESDNDIQLMSEFVSRRHVRINNMPNVCEVEDLDSANGTRVNGERISTYALRHGDQIHVGDRILRFEQTTFEGDEVDSGLREYSDRTQRATVRIRKHPTVKEPRVEDDASKMTQPLKPLRIIERDPGTGPKGFGPKDSGQLRV